MADARSIPPADLMGRFIVEHADVRDVGLSLEQVRLMREAGDAADAILYRIHRVDEAGRAELVGVRWDDLDRGDCLLLTFDTVARARARFEELAALAADRPPPCGVHVQLRRLPDFQPPHVVGLLFPAVCADAVAAWLAHLGLAPADFTDGGPSALRSYERSTGNVILQRTLAPRAQE